MSHFELKLDEIERSAHLSREDVLHEMFALVLDFINTLVRLTRRRKRRRGKGTVNNQKYAGGAVGNTIQINFSSLDKKLFDPLLSRHTYVQKSENSFRRHMRFGFWCQPREIEEFVLFYYTLSYVFSALVSKVTLTKRDVYYLDVGAFKNQEISNKAVDQICSVLQCSRRCINVIGSPRGLVHGELSIALRTGSTVCISISSSVPSMAEPVELITSPCLFVLVSLRYANQMNVTLYPTLNTYICNLSLLN
jgi:hypothetical protein